jgi:hypothetical protein
VEAITAVAALDMEAAAAALATVQARLMAALDAFKNNRT